MPGDRPSDGCQPGQRRVVQARGGRPCAGLGATVGSGDHHHLASSGAMFEHLARGVEHRVVGGHQAGHHGLAEPWVGVDHHPVAGARDGVGGEHHPGVVGGHQPLHHHRDRHGGRIDAQPVAVTDGAGSPQRGPAVAEGVDQLPLPHDAQVGVLLAREGRTRQVFGGGAGAHRHRRRPECGVRLRDRLGHVGGHVQAAQRSLLVGAGADRVAVGVGGDHEPVGHVEPGRDQFTKVRTLATGSGQVNGADGGQRHAEVGHGHMVELAAHVVGRACRDPSLSRPANAHLLRSTPNPHVEERSDDSCTGAHPSVVPVSKAPGDRHPDARRDLCRVSPGATVRTWLRRRATGLAITIRHPDARRDLCRVSLGATVQT